MTRTSAVVLPLRPDLRGSSPAQRPPSAQRPPEPVEYWARLQALRAERDRLSAAARG